MASATERCIASPTGFPRINWFATSGDKNAKIDPIILRNIFPNANSQEEIFVRDDPATQGRHAGTKGIWNNFAI